ncbi:histidine kinase [Asanoa ishikariensis]|uniref:histidine kinase n=1 Tax=Asanoa ishikariensis TaxID=137265 RepID=A0A1H3UU95_9ACTN|nr:nitrate- and nitrite sensing domain-containing protein [Asanoa ishikariensis]GIF65041.1 histidine kinase [Asanoa ishikariensis]SDZ65992.1 Signal transduction histidine kinase [Asanoa ishikariensis]
MLLGRLRIRGKLALLLIAPLLGIVALAVPVVGGRVAVAERADQTARTVDVAGQVGSLVQQLQQERLLSIGYSFQVVDRNRLVLQSAQVTDTIADLRATSDLPVDIQVALDTLPSLAAVRATVLAGKGLPQAVLKSFGEAVDRLINSLGLSENADTTTPAGQQVMALDSVLRSDEGISLVAVQIVLLAALGDKAPKDLTTATMAVLLKDSDRFRSYATPEQNGVYDLVQQGVDARSSTGDFLGRFAADPLGALDNISLPQLFPLAESLMTLGGFVEKRIIADVKVEVGERQRRALTEAYGVALACVLLLLCVVLLSVAVARAVARPLTRLTESADDVAKVAEAELTKVADGELDSSVPVRLEAVDVRARDEVGDLARAFERVQATAARLVERQVAGRRNVAQMFGHVGRRTQNLVGRQLALIDRLERQEADPGRLQHLYRLDHISSRLRRSASSLVVLSGSSGADSHVAPLPLTDVIRLALGEIEDYLRVDIKVPTEISIAPSIIGDLVLVLAELMENATTFSPPHTRVTVTGVVSDPGIRLLVVDHGLGMSPERMAEENARLARRERLDLVPTEVLGLFVVGRLARRHGMRVTLTPTPGGGVTAELEVHERDLVTKAELPPVSAVARARVGNPEQARPELPATSDEPRLAPPVVGGDGSSAPVYDPFRPERRAGVGSGGSSAAPATGPAPAPAGAADPHQASAPPAPEPAETSDEAAVPPPAAAAPEWPIRQRVPGRTEPPTQTPGPARATEDEDPSDAEADAGPRATPLTRRHGAPTGNVPGFDEGALNRASRMLANGQPWNAFVPQPRIAGEAEQDQKPPANQRPASPAKPAGAERPPAAAPERPAPGRAQVSKPAKAAPPAKPARAAKGKPSPELSDEETQAVLRRRVPGARLPSGDPEPAPTSAPPSPADPAAARALVEEFEAGVRYAERQVRGGAVPGARPVPVNGSAKVAVNGTAAAESTGTNGGAASSGQPLNRRQPGATLDDQAPPNERPASDQPPDPVAARDLVQQFESGVARAMRQISAGLGDEEESR